jgi:predicted Zn finger-like uncharacterized protein
MSMVTRCPQCGTTFRVTLQHLRARDGFVRCGRCSEIFNALATLGALTEESDAPALEHEEPDAITAGEHFLVPEEREPALWWTLTMLVAAALVLQSVYLFRVELASGFPGIAPYLQAACGVLGCSIESKQDPRDLTIEDSGLRADPARAEVVILSATIKNSAEQARAYPALELTLTDSQNRPLARRVFLSAEYLRQNWAAKIPPRSEVPLELVLNIGNLNAAGYRLYLFYP